jgi:signal transduction histidine kinase
MFRIHSTETGKSYRLAVIGLSLLSSAALAVTIWVMIDFLKEQSIVEALIKDLPNDAKESAETLAGELRWQFRLTILVVLNVIVTGIAVILLWRAYRSSQASLRDLRALASDVLGCMDQGVITTDRDGLVTSINRRGLELLETHADCIGKPIGKIQSVPLSQYLDDWLSSPSLDMIRDFNVDHRGGTRRLRAFCQTLNDHEGNEVGNVLQVRDVTERVFIEDRMRRMERYMGLGSLVGGLHHEIKNPLAALSLHVQLLEEQLQASDTSDEIKQALTVIRTEIARIGGVLESFRDFASIGQLSVTQVDLVELISQQIELLTPQADKFGIAIEFQQSQAALDIMADRLRLEQVLLNLMLNAMEAMPGGGKLTISACDTEKYVQIEVTDTGCGIPENLRDKILDPYFTTKHRGTGLGLAICDKIMRQHLGSLDFRTSSDGTTFRVLLPKSLRVAGNRL